VTYDGLGRVTSVTDPLNNTTSYALRRGRQPAQRNRPAGQHHQLRLRRPLPPHGDHRSAVRRDVVQFRSGGNLTSLTDPVGNTTAWDYDGLNRVVAETNELNDARTFVYDAANNLLQRTDRNGRVIEYAYDALHRRVESSGWTTSRP
jgi:YD repeat-containing protein